MTEITLPKDLKQPPSVPKLWQRVWRHKYIWIIVVVIGASAVWGPTSYANLSTRSIRYELTRTPISKIPPRDVAVVFGAGVYRDTGKPTPYLQWRVETAVQLYKAHKVKKILMTADNSTTHYNEPIAMQKLAEQLGVPSKDIVLDYAGFDTYDSCYRAHAIFHVSSAALVTQGYHMPRALTTCNAFGLHAIGVNAVHPAQSYKVQYIVREWLSTDKMVVDLTAKPKPTFLGPSEPIKSD